MPGNDCPGDPHYLCVNSVTGTSIGLAVQPGHYYDWWVHACNASGCGTPSSGVLTMHVAPPANVSALCSPDGTNVTVSWSPTSGATGYATRLDYSANNGGPGCQFNWLCSGDDKYGEQGSTVYSTSIVPGSPYVFWVHGMGPAGYGDPTYASFQCNPGVPNEPFPPFTSTRSDYLNVLEGLFFSPLQISSPACLYTAPEGVEPDWQDWLCKNGQSVTTTYPTVNGFSNTPDPYFTWIIAMNNEPIQSTTCPNSGPPNVSAPVNTTGSPFLLANSAASLKIELRHDASIPCIKIPYMSATYIRGAQAGDSRSRLYSWSQLQGKSLVLDVDIQHAPFTAPIENNQTWFRVLTHFRNPATGKRYFINKDYVMTDTTSFTVIAWNWPYTNSFQFPGAYFALPTRSPSFNLPTGLNQIVIPLAAQWTDNFGFGMQPDFLGAEIAIELGPLGKSVSAEIKGARFQ